MKLLDKIFKYLKKKGGVVWEEKSGVGINLLLIATIPLIFGLGFEGTYRTVLSIFKEQYEKGKPLTITGDGEQRRDFTHVDDIVDGMIRVMRAMNGEVDMFYHGAEFELGRGKNYSINEIADMFGEDYPKEYIDTIKGEVRETLCKDETTKETLEWKPKINLGDWINELKTKNN